MIACGLWSRVYRIAFVVTGEPDLYLIPGIGPGGVWSIFSAASATRVMNANASPKSLNWKLRYSLLYFSSQAMVMVFYID